MLSSVMSRKPCAGITLAKNLKNFEKEIIVDKYVAAMQQWYT